MKITDKEAAAMFRADAIAAGLPEWMTPIDIAIALRDWLDSVPENPHDDLWREVWLLRIGKDLDPDDCRDEFPFATPDFWALIEWWADWAEYYERCNDACRGVLVRQQLDPVASRPTTSNGGA